MIPLLTPVLYTPPGEHPRPAIVWGRTCEEHARYSLWLALGERVENVPEEQVKEMPS